ncbi:MAG: 4a-hydroxytetrahydrobiopterin dehydratase [Acidobacteriota bacterium]
MSELAARECIPCKGGVLPLKGHELEDLAARLGGGWEVVDEHHLTKKYKFPNFVEALGFVNRVGGLAEEVNHHPEIHFSWGWVELIIYTHKIDGLTESDFVWAAKAEELIDPSGARE